MLKLLTFILLLAPLWATADAELFNLKSDKTTYVPHEKAILVMNVKTLPQSPNFEVIIKSTVNSSPVEAIKLSEHQYISKIDDIGTGPTVTFSSKYFVRNKYEADEFERAINQADLEIFDLIRARRVASVQERENIDARISLLEKRVSYYRTKLDSLLRLVEERTLVAQVSAPIKVLNSAFIFLSSNREDPVYHTGEPLTLFGHVYLQVSDKEPVVKATLANAPLDVERLLNDEFLIRSENLSVVGNQEAVVKLYLRDKARSIKLVDALSSIAAERARLTQLLEAETDPAERLELQNQIAKLDLVKAHVESILTSLEQLVETVKFRFTVESV